MTATERTNKIDSLVSYRRTSQAGMKLEKMFGVNIGRTISSDMYDDVDDAIWIRVQSVMRGFEFEL